MKADTLTPGSPLMRFCAMLLDGFILITLSLPILAIFGRGDAAMLASFMLTIAYHSHFHANAQQATPGEQIMKLYVMRNDGGRLGLRQSVERTLAYMLPFLPQYATLEREQAGRIIFLLVFCWFVPILFTRSATGLHDLLCNTRVVNKKADA